MTTATKRLRASRGRRVLAVVFGLLSLSAWIQVGGDLLAHAGEPPILTAWQALTAVTAAATAWGSWVGAPWAPVAAVLYGVIAGAMVASLGGLVDVPPSERGGLWTGMVFILAFALASAWWLHRSMRRERARETMA